MKIIDLLNKIANGEEVPKKIKWENTIYAYSDYDKDYLEFPFSEEEYRGLFDMKDSILTQFLNDTVEILEEEKKIPEKRINKRINNYGDLIILGQQDNWLEPTIETDQKINAQLNPYVFEAINENFKDIENKIYEIIDYLKSKGE